MFNADTQIHKLKEEIRILREQNELLIQGLNQCTQDIGWGESIVKHANKIKRIAVETLDNYGRITKNNSKLH